MKKLENRKNGKHSKQYKDYVYTIERLHNTTDGHPNYEIVIYKLNKRFDTLGDIYHHVYYGDIFKFVESFIDKNYIKEVK